MIDAAGRCLLPAFVDCHTHACWAGNRLDEWEQRLRGATYLELLSAGGGIMSTVRAVRAATQQQLTDRLVERLVGHAASWDHNRRNQVGLRIVDLDGAQNATGDR